MGVWIEKAPMPTRRHDLQAIAVEGEIYAISGAGDYTVHAVEIYDVAQRHLAAGTVHSHVARVVWRGADWRRDLCLRRQAGALGGGKAANRRQLPL